MKNKKYSPSGFLWLVLILILGYYLYNNISLKYFNVCYVLWTILCIIIQHNTKEDISIFKDGKYEDNFNKDSYFKLMRLYPYLFTSFHLFIFNLMYMVVLLSSFIINVIKKFNKNIDRLFYNDNKTFKEYIKDENI